MFEVLILDLSEGLGLEKIICLNGFSPTIACQRSSEKVNGEARSGSGSLSVSVSKGRVMGFGHEKPGTVAVLATLGIEV